MQLGQFLYALHGDEVRVTLLTTKLAFTPPRNSDHTRLYMLEEFKCSLEQLNKYQKLIPDVRVIAASSLHDRFLIVDDKVWVIGNSLNSLGEKASMVVRLPDPYEVIERLLELAANAPDLDKYIDNVSTDRAGSEE